MTPFVGGDNLPRSRNPIWNRGKKIVNTCVKAIDFEWKYIESRVLYEWICFMKVAYPNLTWPNQAYCPSHARALRGPLALPHKFKSYQILQNISIGT